MGNTNNSNNNNSIRVNSISESLDKSDKCVVNSINCMFVNARSIMNNLKLHELSAYAAEHKILIIGLAETWLNSEISNSEISLNEFTLYRKDRNEIKDATR